MPSRPQNIQWVLGIDPGFGGTGAVLRLGNETTVVGQACWHNDSADEWEVLRSMSICIPMMETVLGWIEEYDIRSLEVCLENPIYNGNAKTLMKQMALYTLIQTYVFDYLQPVLDELFLTFVNNKSSKRRLTGDGNADKDKMIAACGWIDKSLTYTQKHTLADAYAHSLFAGDRTLPLHLMEQYAVQPSHEESLDV